jgi:hypothetical protein
VYAKKGTQDFLQITFGATSHGNQQFTNFDLNNGSIGSTGATNIGQSIEDIGNGWYRCTHIAIATTTTTTALINYLIIPNSTTARLGTWLGTGNIYIWGAQVQSSQSDSTYLATTTAPQYRGVNGRTAARFNGAQWLATTSQLSSMFTNSAALIYAIARVNLLGSEHQITRASAPAHFALRTKASNAFYFINDDGSADYSETPATAVVNTNYILRGRLSGGSIYAALDSGAGFSEGAGVASGNATTMTATYAIGASAGTAIYGDILALAFANTGSAKPNLERLLSEYYFSRSMLKFDLIKGLYLGNKNDSI